MGSRGILCEVGRVNMGGGIGLEPGGGGGLGREVKTM
jgi:hypothetical protein